MFYPLNLSVIEGVIINNLIKGVFQLTPSLFPFNRNRGNVILRITNIRFRFFFRFVWRYITKTSNAAVRIFTVYVYPHSSFLRLHTF